MLRPKCSLCSRTDKACVFPETVRKSLRNSTHQRKPRPNTKGRQLGWYHLYLKVFGSSPVEANKQADRLLALLESRVDQQQFSDAATSFDLSTAMPTELMPPPSGCSRIDSPPDYHLDHNLESINMQQDGTSMLMTDPSFWNSIMSPDQHVAHPDQFLDHTNFRNDGVPGDLSDLSLELDMPQGASGLSTQEDSFTSLPPSLMPENSPAGSVQESKIPYDDL